MIRDSINIKDHRLTTMEVRFPRFVLAEFNTHRMFSRNSASSRARPIEKVIQEVKDFPFIPEYWGANQKGMQASTQIGDVGAAQTEWLKAKANAVVSAEALLELGVHKQLGNRLLEPFMWHVVIVTSTEWDNFFALRANKEAQPEIRVVAELMKELYEQHDPTFTPPGEWHLPYITQEDYNAFGLERKRLRCISVARCARVSYLTHDGKRDYMKDLELYTRLLMNRHLSPFEHIATPMSGWAARDDCNIWSGNFKGWEQWRKSIPHESNAAAIPEEFIYHG